MKEKTYLVILVIISIAISLIGMFMDGLRGWIVLGIGAAIGIPSAVIFDRLKQNE